MSSWCPGVRLLWVLCLLCWGANMKLVTDSSHREFDIKTEHKIVEIEQCCCVAQFLLLKLIISGYTWLQFGYCPQTLKVLIRLYSLCFQMFSIWPLSLLQLVYLTIIDRRVQLKVWLFYEILPSQLKLQPMADLLLIGEKNAQELHLRYWDKKLVVHFIQAPKQHHFLSISLSFQDLHAMIKPDLESYQKECK